MKHGLTSPIEHDGTGLFEGVGRVDAVRYHSLHAVLRGEEMVPLAWARDENGRVLMAVKHRCRPFYGVQYHPESVCTEGGAEVVGNFWRMAGEWNRGRGRRVVGLPGGWVGGVEERSLLVGQVEWEGGRQEVRRGEVRTKVVGTRGLEVGRVCEMLGVEGSDEFVLLDSAAAPGRWSIIGVLTPGVTRTVRYCVGDEHATLGWVGKSAVEKVELQQTYEGSIWRFLAKFMDARKAVGGREESPFWGGLVGYFNYEVGVASLDVPLLPREGTTTQNRPDVNLAFAERSIVIDSHTGRVYIQTLLPKATDNGWLEDMKLRITQEDDIVITPFSTPPPRSPTTPTPPSPPTITPPNKTHYLSAIHTAQHHLSLGNSYELCITAQTTIHHPLTTTPHPWHLYTALRTRNPAPYAAYLRLGPTTLLSSSPERFLSWSRTGICQLRPIKGTVRKTPTTTLASATSTLNTPKERAENLMIVDLIRHDLHRVAGNSVCVRKLMGVEEYSSVYQLVSVIEGTLQGEMTGFDVLAGSLPPGSMTGAPKKRSVELLQGLEKGERGVYAGVAGYWSVCGGGDWSVVIRSAVREEGEREWVDGVECEVWRIGAGGAITALSVPEEEWEEMETKLSKF